MRCKGMLRLVVIGLLTAGVSLAAAGTAWTQQSPRTAPTGGTPPTPASDSPGLPAMAVVAGVIGSFFYIPFKVGAICPGMALASEVSLVATGGDKATADSLLRTGCRGTYFITPGMVRGQEEFEGSGAQ